MIKDKELVRGTRVEVQEDIEGYLSKGDRGTVDYTIEGKDYIAYCKWDKGIKYGLYVYNDLFEVIDDTDDMYEEVYNEIKDTVEGTVLDVYNEGTITGTFILTKSGYVRLEDLKERQRPSFLSVRSVINKILRENKEFSIKANRVMDKSNVERLKNSLYYFKFEDSMITEVKNV